MSKKGQKKCRACNTYFKPTYSTTQRVCSPSCAISHAKKEKAKNKKKIAEAICEKANTQRLKSALTTTKTAVHAFIRKRDLGRKCITCNTILSGIFDAGHYYHGSKANALRFDLDNIHGQCISCNRTSHGKQNSGRFEEYTNELPKRIGKERFANLQAKYLQSNQSVHKWHIEDLKAIRTNVKSLDKSMNIKRL